MVVIAFLDIGIEVAPPRGKYSLGYKVGALIEARVVSIRVFE